MGIDDPLVLWVKVEFSPLLTSIFTFNCFGDLDDPFANQSDDDSKSGQRYKDKDFAFFWNVESSSPEKDFSFIPPPPLPLLVLTLVFMV